MPDMTVVYYTSNMDIPNLEHQVRKTIYRNCKGLPIVSVSQQPLDFGHNIVVGDIGRSWQNVYMQQRLGVEWAKTKYVAICESDFLLPRSFFQFRPPDEETYCWPTHGYITFQWRPSLYFRKRMTQTVGIVGRDHLLKMLPVIHEGSSTPTLERLMSRISKTGTFDMGSVVTLKTGSQMHRASPFSRSESFTELPEWGPAKRMWRRYG